MSERYECVLLTGLRGEVIKAFHDLQSPLPIGLGELDRDLFAVYIKEGRLFNPPEVEKIAVSLSMRFGKAFSYSTTTHVMYGSPHSTRAGHR
jgi:hypothetical protein